MMPQPVAPRRAATVLLLRRAPDGLEVLMVRRSQRASFMADSYVFPGGRVDQADAAHGEALSTRVAALRELHEEAGMLLPGPPSPSALPLFSHWITPSVESRRFDTDFFVCALPEGPGAPAEPRVDGQEVVDLLWLTPAEALSRYAEGRLKLPPPTHANLLDLQQEIERLAPDGGDLLARLLLACAERRPPAVLPKLVPDPDSGGIAIVLPWAEDFAALPGEGHPLPPPPGRFARRYVLDPAGLWRVC